MLRHVHYEHLTAYALRGLKVQCCMGVCACVTVCINVCVCVWGGGGGGGGGRACDA